MPTRPTVHPSADALRAFGLGKLDDTSAGMLMDHLDECEDCCKVVAAQSGDDFLVRLRQAQGRNSTPAPPKELSTTLGSPKSPVASPVSSTAIPNLPPELAGNPQYDILRELGRGGMGVVYLAKNKLMDRLEVLKVVNKTLLDRPGSVERFLREIRSAAKLGHANVVAAYSAVQVGDVLAFAMEYVEGQDLAAVVKSHGPLPVVHACHYVQQAALGLQHAFEKKMVHRDIKPQNLILAREGKKHLVKVLDFGLAKVTREKVEDTGLTGEGKMLGTPDYVAPEQTLDAASADIRADIYSLGCTLYFLLSGSPPFKAKSLYGVLQAHHSVEARLLNLVRPDVPEELAAVVRKMMAKEPAKRYQKPIEVVQALDAFVRPAAKGVPKSSPGLSAGVAEVQPDRLIAPAAEGSQGKASVPRAPSADRRDALTKEPSRPVPSRQSSGVGKRKPVAGLASRKKWRIVGSMAAGVLLLALLGMWTGGVFDVTTKNDTRGGKVAEPDEKAAATRWQPGPAEGVLPGLVARPAVLPGIKRWQAERTHAIRSHIRGVAWSPDGKHLVYGGEKSIVRIYDAASLRLLQVLTTDTDTMHCVAWSPDGAWLASGGEEGTVRLWRADGTTGPAMQGHKSKVCSLTWSPDGKWLASGGHWGDGSVRLWSRDGKPGPVLEHKSAVQAIAWSPDSKTLASADSDAKTIRLWNPADGKPIGNLGNLPRSVTALAWSPDGKYLASNGADWEKDRIGGWLWDVAEQKQKVALEKTLIGFDWLGWSREGKLASAGEDGYVQIYDPTTGKIISSTPNGPSLTACWSPDGRQIADTQGRIWDVAETGRELTLARGRLSSKSTSLISVAWSPNGDHLASGGEEQTIRLWESGGKPGAVLKGHEGMVLSIAWSPDGTRLASAGWDQTIRLWDRDGTPGPILRGHAEIVWSVAWSRDGKQLVSAGGDKTIRLWSANGMPGAVLRGHQKFAVSAAWSPDGQRLVSSSIRETAIRLWSADGTPGLILEGHQAGVWAVAWNPDGRQLASASADQTVRLWGTDGTPGPVLRGHDSSIRFVAWSPDGTRLASASADHTVRLWRANGTAEHVLKGHGNFVNSVDWSPDGKRLVSAGHDGTIRVWNANGTPERTIVLLPDDKAATFSAAGELLYGDAEVIEKELVYLMEKEDGRIDVLSPSEFLQKFRPPKRQPDDE